MLALLIVSVSGRYVMRMRGFHGTGVVGGVGCGGWSRYSAESAAMRTAAAVEPAEQRAVAEKAAAAAVAAAAKAASSGSGGGSSMSAVPVMRAKGRLVVQLLDHDNATFFGDFFGFLKKQTEVKDLLKI